MGQQSRRSRRVLSSPRAYPPIGARTHAHAWWHAFHENVDGVVVGVGSEKAVDRSAAFTDEPRRWNNAADRALTLRLYVCLISVRDDRSITDSFTSDEKPVDDAMSEKSRADLTWTAASDARVVLVRERAVVTFDGVLY